MRPRGSASRPAFSRSRSAGRALPPGRVQHRVGRDHLAARELRQDAAVARSSSTAVTVSEKRSETRSSRRWYCSASMISASTNESSRGLALDHGHPHADRREDRGVLDADHAGADDGHRGGDALELEDAVRVEHGAAVEVDVRRAAPAWCRPRSRSCSAVTRRLPPSGPRSSVCSSMKRADAGQQVDVVARQLVADHLGLAIDHAAGPPEQVVDRDLRS